MAKREITFGRTASLTLLAIWLVGFVQIVKWVIQGLF